MKELIFEIESGDITTILIKFFVVIGLLILVGYVFHLLLIKLFLKSKKIVREHSLRQYLLWTLSIVMVIFSIYLYFILMLNKLALNSFDGFVSLSHPSLIVQMALYLVIVITFVVAYLGLKNVVKKI